MFMEKGINDIRTHCEGDAKEGDEIKLIESQKVLMQSQYQV